MSTHGVAWMLLIVFLAVAIAVGIACVAVVRQVQIWTADLPTLENTDAFNLAETSTVYASDGETVLAEFQIENRIPLDSLDDISEWVITATLDTEDTRFYEHNGVDYWGLVRAVINNITGGTTQGASTITQQLIRNTVLSDEASEITLERKVREATLALEMEELYTKDEILLMYLNTINYGDGCYGIEAAAQHYFSKSASELTLVEAATLVGIPQSPSAYNPVDNPDACVERRNVVLYRMYSEGDITAAEYEDAIATPLELNVSEDTSYNGIYQYEYFTTYVRDLLLEEYSTAEIFEGGWTIYTTLDVDAQEALENSFESYYDGLNESLEFAGVAIDPNTGYILAMVGGKDFFEDQFNIATTKGRPTGSTFKVFTLVTAIEQGISPTTLVDCSTPVTVTTSTGEVDINNMSNIDYGIIPITTATYWSVNTGYVRLELEVGIEAVIETAYKMGITAELPAVPSLTIGVADITPLEMASAYGTLATYGIHYETTAITKIVDKTGNTIYEANTEGTRVLSESVAGATTSVLEGVTTVSGATGTAITMFDRRPVAAKTGSSDDWLDRWAIAYTPSISVAMWLGDRDNEVGYSGANLCTYAMNVFLNDYLADTEYEDFPSYTEPTYDNPYNEKQNLELGAEETLNEAPDTVGSTLEEALEALEDYPVLWVEEYNDTVEEGIVYDQEVDADLKEIILYVSKGPDPNKNTVTVTFNLNGGTLDGSTRPVSITVNAGDTITLPTPTRDGYTFRHWYPGSIAAGDTYTVTEDIIFTAQWVAVTTDSGDDSDDDSESDGDGG